MIVKVAETEQEKQHAFAVRKKVFVEEQRVPEEEELDQFDETATHFVLYDKNLPAGAGRFRVKDGKGKIERVCVLSEYRGKNAGVMVMDAMELFAREQSVLSLILNAQTHALGFYEKLGYSVTSEEFLDAGIPHVTMEKILS
ncbi:GNAT family N-acetyltransferase [Jeotgalibacillus sp. R-1-5s-1]|uniref:GNAT family N-acetyltransferase n=1 Tax=Jeotgalibacillus sp. R-1-5s-1 TaxID=2555897 RepID=UPI00106C77F0|nr:GNAT family N-acetyltransferase [Jeotgalibacillus sp. R-1-5s-1]TFD97576.1 GNAT family N-acetyltransferase [Jeotgalibacillus sp. R-1-5s-1]